MNFFINFLLAFKRVFDFKGESSILEFWSFFLLNILFGSVLLIFFKTVFDTELPAKIYRYVSLLPLYACGFRRLRNAGISPWLFLIPLVNLFLAGLPEKNKEGVL